MGNYELKRIPRMETIDKTAELFGLPKHFVRQKVLTGEIVAVSAGRRYLVNVDKFAEYLDTHTICEQTAETGGYFTPIPAKL